MIEKWLEQRLMIDIPFLQLGRIDPIYNWNEAAELSDKVKVKNDSVKYYYR